MILNSLDTSEKYLDEHLLAFMSNLHSLSKKNDGKRYSHQLFLDIHKKYKDLKAQSKNQSEAMRVLHMQAEEMQESYSGQIDHVDAIITILGNEIQAQATRTECGTARERRTCKGGGEENVKAELRSERG